MISIEILYSKIENGIKIIGINGRASEIKIPEKINGITVTEIGDYAFYIENELDLAENNESEVSYTFTECMEKTDKSKEQTGEAIKRIYLPDTVTKIGEYAFCGCKHLYFVHLPENLLSISDHMFSGCESIEEIYIPNSIQNTESYAFHNCRKLKKAIIPEGCKKIGNYAFYNCRNIEEVVIPKSIEEIGTSLFLNCIRLKYITFGRYFNVANIIAPLTQELHITVDFDDGQRAKLVVPDFQYEYIEDTPARLFHRVNYGTGHIFHQCISNSGIDFRHYDSYFYLTKREDGDIMVMLFAMYRLEYPYALTNDKKEIYINYIKENAKFVSEYYINNNDIDKIKLLSELNIFDENNIDDIIKISGNKGATEITGFLMDYKHRNFGIKNKKTFEL